MLGKSPKLSCLVLSSLSVSSDFLILRVEVVNFNCVCFDEVKGGFPLTSGIQKLKSGEVIIAKAKDDIYFIVFKVVKQSSIMNLIGF